MAQKLEMKTLAQKYHEFGSPAARILIGGKEVRLREGVYLERAEVVSGVGRDPDMAVLAYKVSRIKTGCVSALEGVLKLGEKVEVKAGYGDTLTRVFLGYLHEAEVSVRQAEYAEYTLICLDVKGLMKKNNSFLASGEKRTSQIMEGILKTAAYGFLIEKRHVDSLPEAFNRDCVILGDTHYDWLCGLAEYLDYEFFCRMGELFFRRAGKDAAVVLELTGDQGLLSVRAAATMDGQYGSVQVGGYNRRDERVSGAENWKTVKGPFLDKMEQRLRGFDKVIWDMGLETAAQASFRAKAVLGRIARQCSRMEALSIGIPEIMPGTCAEIKVEGMASLSGRVYMEEVRHLLDAKGYRTVFKGSRV